MLAFLTAASSLLCPQQPTSPAAPEPRQRAFGMARRADRSPWRGATVRLLAEPFPGCAARDLVEVTADERGEFRAEILVGLPYVAWACSPSGTGDDAWLVSQRVVDVVPRLPIVLEERRTEPRVVVDVRRLAAWRLGGPATLWCSGDAAGSHALALPLAADGEQPAIVLPPMGTGERWLFVAAGNGLDLLRRRVPPDCRGRYELVVPPPREVAITVHDSSGVPVAGASIDVRARGSTTLPPRTDAEGHATLLLPARTEADALFLADAPLWAEAPGHLTSRLWRPKNATGPWLIVLQPSPVPRATLEWAPGRPLANAPLQLGGVEATVEPFRNGRRHELNGQFANEGHRRTAADGTVTLPYDATYPVSLGVLLPPDGMHELRQRFGAGLSPLALLHAAIPAAPTFTARVSDLRPVRFVVRHHDRSPAPRAHVRLGGGPSPGLGLAYVADQASACTVLLPPSDEILVAVEHEGAGEVVRVAVPLGNGAKAADELSIELPAPIVVRGTVVDDAGAPVPGATIQLGQQTRSWPPEWQAVEPARPASSAITGRGYLYPPMTLAWFRRAAKTDADGRFELRLPGRRFPLQFHVVVGTTVRTTPWDEAEKDGPGGGEVRLVVQ